MGSLNHGAGRPISGFISQHLGLTHGLRLILLCNFISWALPSCTVGLTHRLKATKSLHASSFFPLCVILLKSFAPVIRMGSFCSLKNGLKNPLSLYLNMSSSEAFDLHIVLHPILFPSLWHSPRLESLLLYCLTLLPQCDKFHEGLLIMACPAHSTKLE